VAANGLPLEAAPACIEMSDTAAQNGKAPALPTVRRRNPIAAALYTYDLWTGLYMLDPWEKALFSA